MLDTPVEGWQTVSSLEVFSGLPTLLFSEFSLTEKPTPSQEEESRLNRREPRHASTTVSLLDASFVAWCKHCSVPLPRPWLGVWALFACFAPSWHLQAASSLVSATWTVSHSYRQMDCLSQWLRSYPVDTAAYRHGYIYRLYLLPKNIATSDIAINSPSISLSLPSPCSAPTGTPTPGHRSRGLLQPSYCRTHRLFYRFLPIPALLFIGTGQVRRAGCTGTWMPTARVISFSLRHAVLNGPSRPEGSPAGFARARPGL